jgi:hypothetical protein
MTDADIRVDTRQPILGEHTEDVLNMARVPNRKTSVGTRRKVPRMEKAKRR